VNLSIRVKQFIDREWDQKSPLLLGYSGGFDSKALLYALLKTAAAGSLYLAHIDHGWREESKAEAESLAEEAASLKIPFYSTRLLTNGANNREEAGRLARLLFFRSLFDQIPFQALLLAHHADDVAETALKRLLEGAHLQNLGGMTEMSRYQEMMVWRPLLGIRKEEILREKLSGLDDATNRCPKFLRSRIRSDILPMLTSSFGKEVSTNLTLFSERAFELKEYLDRKIASFEVQEGPWGKAIYLEGVERVEARHFLLKQASVSRGIIEAVLNNLQGSNLFFGPFIVHRGWVFLRSNCFPLFGQKVILRAGRFVSGNWEVEVQEWKNPLEKVDWKNVWKGEFILGLPDGILKIDEKISFEAYRTIHIPPFLRSFIPSLEQKNIFARFDCPRWQVRFFVGVTSSASVR
jgi:tRNA(Ile)-lysidine synthase